MPAAISNNSLSEKMLSLLTPRTQMFIPLRTRAFAAITKLCVRNIPITSLSQKKLAKPNILVLAYKAKVKL